MKSSIMDRHILRAEQYHSSRKATFEEWKKLVDKEVIARTGMSADDLPDYAYRDCYDDGVSPKNTAARAIRNAKDF